MKQEPAVQKDKEIFFHQLREHGREKKKKGFRIFFIKIHWTRKMAQ